MKLVASLAFLTYWLLAQAVEPIQSLVLDERIVVEVPVATNRVTTISFPGPITAIDAASVSTDPKTPGDFQLAHTKGSAFLSLRALAPRARANLNVRWNTRTYVFELTEQPNPVLALNLRTLSSPVAARAPRLSTTQLLALLDKAKAFALLKAQHPKAVADVEWRSYANQTNTTDYGDFQVRLEELYRFEPEDSLVFRVLIHNTSDSPLRYAPGSWAIRVGARVYPQSISDGGGLVPPKTESVVYFAITGTPDGGRNELSIHNDFSVLVARIPAPTSPTSPTSPAPTNSCPQLP